MNLSWLKASWPLLLALLMVATLWMHGSAQWDQGYAKAYAEADAALQKLKRLHAEEIALRAVVAERDAKTAAQRLREAQVRYDQLASELADTQRENRQTTDRLTGEIARVTTLYRQARDAAPEPVPACVFTRGFVRVWDEATGAALPVPADPDRAAAPAASAGAAEQLDSGLGQADVLGHHARYAEQCRNTAAQLNRLIDALEAQ
jgi:hypothetical protein